MYFVAIHGEPGDASGWGWSFSGHHVSVNYTLRDGFAAATPAFFGSDPAWAPMPGGLRLRPLAAEEDMARSLLALLSPDQLQEAVPTDIAPPDIMQSNRSRVEDAALPLGAMDMMPQKAAVAIVQRFGARTPPSPEVIAALRAISLAPGLAAEAMESRQLEVFRRLIGLYHDRMPEPVARQYASQLDADGLRDTTFAWAGSLEVGGPHYYRIQSKRLLVEYDNVQGGANHIHTVWRDTEHDFGGDVLASHYSQSHSG